jgi:hypothetical protein
LNVGALGRVVVIAVAVVIIVIIAIIIIVVVVIVVFVIRIFELFGRLFLCFEAFAFGGFLGSAIGFGLFLFLTTTIKFIINIILLKERR